MKNYLIAVISAAVVGSVLALYIYSKNEVENIEVSNEVYKVYMFQLGVFSEEENAKEYIENTEYGIIEEDKGLYYIYGALYSNEELVIQLKNYYDENDIAYQIKDTIINEYLYEEIKSYEQLLIESKKIEIILKANEIILNKYTII